MKIGILTLYNADYGSFYQAVCLYEQLEKMGHSCELIHILNREKHILKNFIGGIVAHFPFVAKKIARKIAPYNTYLTLKKDLDAYKISKVFFSMKKATEEYDCVVIGADELWSAQNPYVGYIKTYYGHHITCPHISYATSGISLGKPSQKILGQIKNNLTALDFISVRDPETKKWVSELTGKECTQVIDPVLLNPFFVKKRTEKNYILVYGETFSPIAVRQILAFANNIHAKIKSASWKQDWCEFVNISSASDLIRLFSEAKWCMVSTFHGTVFSILHEKNFTSFYTEQRGEKVCRLLEMLHLETRLYAEKGTIPDIKIDYAPVNAILKKERTDSLFYLKHALEQIGGKPDE